MKKQMVHYLTGGMERSRCCRAVFAFPPGILLLVLALGVLFTGCSQESRPKTKTRIDYMYSGAVENIKIMETVKQVFEKENPNYELNLNFVSGWSQLKSKVLTDIAGGMSPDIVVATPSWVSDFYERGALYDLTKFVTQDPRFQEIKKDIYPTELLDLGKIKGEYWAIPGWQNPVVLFYNKRLFKESGVPFPHDNWTWEEFNEAIKRLTKRDGEGKVTQYGLIYSGDIYGLLPFNDASVINQDGSKVVLNSEKSYRILKWFYDLLFKYKYAYSAGIGRASRLGMQDYQLFQTQRGAMFIGGHYFEREFLKNANLDFDVAVIPRMAENAKIFDNVLCWVVLKRGKNHQGALKLLDYLAGPVFQKEVCKLNNDVPILKSLQDSPLFLRSAKRPEHSQAFISSLAKPFFGERYLSKYLLKDAVNLELAFIGKKGLRQALDEDTRILQRAIDEARREGKLKFNNF